MSVINYHKIVNSARGKVSVSIDPHSGFCFGVVNAIDKAETNLAISEQLLCLGNIVHNNEEVNRLQAKGLKTITNNDFANTKSTKVLFRTHGEPPEKYQLAKSNNIEIVDATCSVVLKLQQRIKKAWEQSKTDNSQIVVIGKKGHAEVIGLVGQTQNEAIVIENTEDISAIDHTKDTVIFAQTTISIDKFNGITEAIRKISTAQVISHDTICRQVANRAPKLNDFVKQHQLIFFVGGQHSSNAKYLYQVCLQANKQTQFISSANDINMQNLNNVTSIGICGATSTPQWLMEDVAQSIENYLSESLLLP